MGIFDNWKKRKEAKPTPSPADKAGGHQHEGHEHHGHEGHDHGQEGHSPPSPGKPRRKS